MRRVKYWENIADNLSKAGWSWGCVSAIDSNGRTTWIADAHRATEPGTLLCTRDKKLTAFVELEAAIRAAKVNHRFPRDLHLRGGGSGRDPLEETTPRCRNEKPLKIHRELTLRRAVNGFEN